MMRIGKTLWLAVALSAATLLLGGCPGQKGAGGGGGHDANTAAVPGGIVRLPLEIGAAEPELLALDFSDQRLYALARCLEVPLVRSDSAGQLYPALASSWDSADGGTTWTFTLRSLTGHEDDPGYAGKLLQARFEQILQGTPGPLLAQLADLVAGAQLYAMGKAGTVSGIAVVGAELTLTLTRPDQLAPLWLSQPGLGIAPGGLGAEDAYGPFVLSSNSGAEWVLLPNAQALDGAPLLAELHFVMEPDRGKQLELFKQGLLDTANLSVTAAAEVAEDTDMAETVVRHVTAAIILGQYNMSRFPWGDSKFQSKLGLRQALNFAIDRENLETALNGQFKTWPHFLPPAMQDDLDQELLAEPLYPGAPDLDAAMQGQKAAGHEQGSQLVVGMDLGYLKRGWLAELAAPILEDWEQISIKMRPFPLTPDELRLRLQNTSHEIVLRQACPAYPSPDALYYPLLYSTLAGNGGNWQYLKDEQVDSRIREAQATGDAVERKKRYRELSADLEQRALSVFLGYYAPTLLLSPKLAGYSLTPYDFDASLPAQDFAKLGLKAGGGATSATAAE